MRCEALWKRDGLLPLDHLGRGKRNRFRKKRVCAAKSESEFVCGRRASVARRKGSRCWKRGNSHKIVRV